MSNLQKKICIYLDQYAVSEMLDSKEGDLWFEIKELLQILHQQNKIFCPASIEHYFETSAKDFEASNEHDTFLRLLSDGYCIKPELFITSQLISSRIRNNKITLNTYMYHNNTKPIDNKYVHTHFKEKNENFKEIITGSLTEVNELRGLFKNDAKTVSQYKDLLINLGRQKEIQNFIGRLKELRKEKGITIRGDNLGTVQVPNWIDLIIHQLLGKHKFTDKEVVLLISEFEKYGFSNIPTLDIRFFLTGLITSYGKKEDKNDQIDIMRISNGFSISDIFLTDKKRKHEINELGLPKKYNTKVYSGTQNDLECLRNDLKSLE